MQIVMASRLLGRRADPRRRARSGPGLRPTREWRTGVKEYERHSVMSDLPLGSSCWSNGSILSALRSVLTTFPV